MVLCECNIPSPDCRNAYWWTAQNMWEKATVCKHTLCHLRKYFYLFDNALSLSCRYHIISNEVKRRLCAVEGEGCTFYFIFTGNILLFLPYPFTTFSFFFFPFSFKFDFLSGCRKITNIVYKHRLKSSLSIHVCTYIHNFVCMSFFWYMCTCVCVYLHKHARAGAICELVWIRSSEHGFSLLIHSKHWSQCSSATLFCSLIKHSSMQHEQWSRWTMYPTGLQLLFPVFKYLILVPYLIFLLKHHDLSRIAAKVAVSHLVCLLCPPFPSSRIALNGVSLRLPVRNHPWCIFSDMPAYDLTMKPIMRLEVLWLFQQLLDQLWLKVLC